MKTRVIVEVVLEIDADVSATRALTQGKTYVRKALRGYTKEIGHPLRWTAQPVRATRLGEEEDVP